MINQCRNHKRETRHVGINGGVYVYRCERCSCRGEERHWGILWEDGTETEWPRVGTETDYGIAANL